MTPLSDIEARVLGSLSEKSFTTPDLYPLSINALTNACNQKTSRDPVMSLSEADVARALSSLKEKNLASPRSEPGSRITKFAHRIDNLLGGGTSKEIAIVTVLLLRGAQTSGEIRIRTDRMASFESVAEVEGILQSLAGRPEPVVVRLARQPGQKEARYQHLFCGPVAAAQTDTAPSVVSVRPAAPDVRPPAAAAQTPVRQLADLIGGRLTALEQRLAYLETRLSALENRPPSA